jgi:hypothetical protein
MPSNESSVAYWSRILTRRERIKLRLTWPYWRQTRLIEPVWSWWVNRG